MDLVFIYLSITMFIFVLVLSSLLPPIGLTPALACAPPSLWALPLLQETLWGWRARKDMLLGRRTCAQAALLGCDS